MQTLAAGLIILVLLPHLVDLKLGCNSTAIAIGTESATLEDKLPACCSVEQRAELLRQGLGERIPSVRETALYLLQSWFSDGCSRDMVKLLSLLDVQLHTGNTAYCAVSQPHAHQQWHVLQLVHIGCKQLPCCPEQTCIPSQALCVRQWDCILYMHVMPTM